MDWKHGSRDLRSILFVFSIPLGFILSSPLIFFIISHAEFDIKSTSLFKSLLSPTSKRLLKSSNLHYTFILRFSLNHPPHSSLLFNMPHTPSAIFSPTLTSLSTTPHALSAFPLAFLLDGGDSAPAAVPAHLQRELAVSAARKADIVTRNAAREATHFGLKRSGAVRKPKLTRKGRNTFPAPVQQEEGEGEDVEGHGHGDGVEVEEPDFPLACNLSCAEPRAGRRMRVRTRCEMERAVGMDLEMGGGVLSFTALPVTPSEDTLRMSDIAARRNGSVDMEVMCASSEQLSRANQRRRWERGNEDGWKGGKVSEEREEMREQKRLEELREEEMCLEARQSSGRFEIGPEGVEVDAEVVEEEVDQRRWDSGYEGEDGEKGEKIGEVPKAKAKKEKCGGVVRVLRLAFCRPEK
jgi:hypothetical protein